MHADADSGATVAEVAYRWGFGNLGRFARVYADRYGPPPLRDTAPMSPRGPLGGSRQIRPQPVPRRGRHPDDPRFTQLVAALTESSPQFRDWWAPRGRPDPALSAAAAALFRFTERPRLTPHQNCLSNNHDNRRSNK